MKTWLTVALILIAATARAGDISLEFKEIPISQLAQAIVKGILKQDYVIAPEAAGVESKVSISVQNLDREGVKYTLSEVLQGVGLQLAERRGVLYLEKKGMGTEPPALSASPPGQFKPAAPIDEPLKTDEEPRIYFPKFRGSDYLALAIRAVGAKLIDGTAQNQQFPVQNYSQFGQFGMIQPAMQQQPQTGKATSSLWRDVLVYTGKRETLDKAEKLLAQLDRPSVAVQLRGAVLEVSDTSENIRSLSVGGLLSILGLSVGVNYEAGRSVGNAITLNKTNLSAILSAVDGDTRFRYLSEPSLRVLEGETAKLTVGQDVPVRGAIQTDKNGTIIQSVEYKTAGLVFEVTPTVYESMLRLKIGQQISSFTTTTTSGIDSPTMMKREASTVVQAEDGEVIAIAGLDESRETNSSSGLSWLPSFLQSKNNNKSRSQILLLLEVKKLPASAI